MKIWNYCKGWFKWFYGKGNKRYSIPYAIGLILLTILTAGTWYKLGRACNEYNLTLKEVFFGIKPDPVKEESSEEDEEDIFAE